MCDGAVDYAQNIPVLIITHMLGIAGQHGDQFREWITMVAAGPASPTSRRSGRRTEAIAAYFRRADQGTPRKSGRGSRQLPDRSAVLPMASRSRTVRFYGALRLLLVAGIDTTWSAIGSSLWHLATHAQDRGNGSSPSRN